MKLPIPDDWNGSDWCEWAVCWPDSPTWEAILMGFLTLPQRGRTWDERTGSVQDVQLIGRQITDENLPLWGCLVSCRDTSLADSIRYLADRLAANNGCCSDGPGPGITGGGTGGSAGTTEGPSSVDDGDVQQPPPAGWASWEEYFANKCGAANYIVDQWRDDLERAQTANFYAGATLTVVIRLLALALLTPIPGDEIVLMAATVIAAVGAGLLNGVLEALEAVFTSFRDDLVCSLYEADNVASAASAAYAIFETNVDSEVPLVETWALSLTRHWLNPDNLNRLFEANPDVEYPTGDCSGCEDPMGCLYELRVSFGNTISRQVVDGVLELTLGASWFAAGGYWLLQINENDYPALACCYQFSLVEIVSGTWNPGAGNAGWTFDCANGGPNTFTSAIPAQHAGLLIALTSTEAFQIRIDVTMYQ